MEDTNANATIESDTDELEASGPPQLREALKREQAKTAKLTAQLMDRAYTEAGLDPSKGLGKAIAKEYDGEPTAEALLAFAKDEYDYQPQTTDPAPEATQRRAAQEKIEKVEAATVPSNPLTESEALHQASASGDRVTAGNIKAAKLRRIIEKQNAI